MNLLRGHHPAQSSHVATLFEIRVNSTERDVVILRGSPSDSSGAVLKGTVVLSINDSMQARNITLTLRGKSRACWNETFLTSSRVQSARLQKEERTVYEKTWSFLPSTAHTKTIGVGNYEYPFAVDLPGDIPESVEGLEFGSIKYTMQATVDRPGFSSNLFTKKHIRIVRTLSVDSLEMAQTLSVDNTWPNKIEYAISIPTKSYPIGSPIPISFKLVPLLKGLSIAKIICTLKEYQSFTIKAGYHGSPAAKEVDRTICSTTLTDIEKDVPNWEIEQSLQIPPTLTDCVQDCEVGHIKIRHKLKFTVSLQNPDGHVSELRAALPVSLLIPPQLFNGGGSFTTMNPNDPDNQLPSYDSHIYDRLYDGIETPLPSGMNTPAQSRSRRNSMDGADSQNTEATHRALVAGLHRLTMTPNGHRTPPVNGHVVSSGVDTGTATPSSGHSTPHRSAPNSFTPAFSVDELAASLEHSHSGASSVRQSPRITPQEHEPPAPFTAEDMEGLNRIPSYGTATTRAAAGPLSSSLPDYENTGSTTNSGATTPSLAQPAALTAVPPSLARPPAARTTSHRSGVLRAAHDRFTRARDH